MNDHKVIVQDHEKIMQEHQDMKKANRGFAKSGERDKIRTRQDYGRPRQTDELKAVNYLFLFINTGFDNSVFCFTFQRNFYD